MCSVTSVIARRGVVVGVLVAVAAAVALGVAYSPLRPAVAPDEAIAAALADRATATGLAGTHWDRATAAPVDDRLDRVSFFAGSQIVAEVAVDRDLHVEQSLIYKHQAVPYGDWIAYQPALLAGLSALFVLAAGVAPLRRVRNLDAAMALSLLAPVVLLRQRYIDASVIAAVPGLAYLFGRCCWIALAGHGESPPCRPLISALMPGWDAAGRMRVLRLVLGALALVFVMVGISSPDAVDVAYAVMEGATKLIGGVLPYGHLPGDVVHGDTYPLLSYVLYTPLALISPVRSTWDSVDLALAAAVAAALATAVVLRRVVSAIGRIGFLGEAGAARPDGNAAPPEPDEEAGLRAAIVWLSFPPVLIAVSSGTTDLVLAAMVLIALALWRRPALASGMIAAAGWLKLAPFALLPMCLAPLRGRRLASALAAVLLVSAPLVLLLIALGGMGGIGAMLHGLAFQFSRGSPQSVWAALGVGNFQPLAQGALLGLIVTATLRIRAEAGLAADRARVGALAAAILIGLQLCADYWSFLYLTWVIPLLCVAMFGAATVSAPELRTASSARLRLGEALAS